MSMYIFNSLDEFASYYETQNIRFNKDPFIQNLLFTIKWQIFKSPQETPFIAIYEDGSIVRFAFFSCGKVNMKKLSVTEKGTRKYEDSFDLPVYMRAFTYQILYNISSDFFKMVMDALFDYPVDVILIYVYKQNYEQLTSILEQQQKYKYYANCYSNAFEGEIGHNRFDSMQIIFPNTFEEIFQPFKKKKQHRYNFRKVKKVHRIAETQYDVQYKYITPLSEISESDLEKMFLDVDFIFQNSWQSEYNTDNHKSKLAFLHQHKKLILLLVYADGVPASYFYGYVHDGKVWESWTAYNAAFARYSFGMIALVQFLKLCIDSEIQSIEFGGTTHKYKVDIVNKKEPIHEIVVFNPVSSISRKLKLLKTCYPKTLI